MKKTKLILCMTFLLLSFTLSTFAQQAFYINIEGGVNVPGIDNIENLDLGNNWNAGMYLNAEILTWLHFNVGAKMMNYSFLPQDETQDETAYTENVTHSNWAIPLALQLKPNKTFTFEGGFHFNIEDDTQESYWQPFAGLSLHFGPGVGLNFRYITNFVSPEDTPTPEYIIQAGLFIRIVKLYQRPLFRNVKE